MALALALISLESLAEFKSPHAGSRKQNKEGNILVSYDRDRGKEFVRGFDLQIQTDGKQHPKLRSSNGSVLDYGHCCRSVPAWLASCALNTRVRSIMW